MTFLLTLLLILYNVNELPECGICEFIGFLYWQFYESGGKRVEVVGFTGWGILGNTLMLGSQ